MMRSARPMLKDIATKLRKRFGCLPLVIAIVVVSVGFYFSYLKVLLFDLPVLEAKRQSAVNIISAFTANDMLIEESHYPLRKTAFCLWGHDSWTYESSRTRSEIVSAFDLSFVSWEKWSGSSYPAAYNNGPFIVSIDWMSGNLNTVTTYTVRLGTYDPVTPQCGPD